jgi:hypothetical protein
MKVGRVSAVLCWQSPASTPEGLGKKFDPLATGKTPRGVSHHDGISLKTQAVVVMDEALRTPSSADGKYRGALSSQWNAKAREIKTGKGSRDAPSPRAAR